MHKMKNHWFKHLKIQNMVTKQNKMVVEIWSDIMCPFCYLGKRKFENAMAIFPDSKHIEVVWKSFQLMPHIKTDTNLNIHEFLSREKGFPKEQAIRMNEQIALGGKQVGLLFNFDRVVIANTFNAHQFLHEAKKQGRQNEAEERLFEAFFTEGKNIDDFFTLKELGKDIGLNTDNLAPNLQNNVHADGIKADISEAQKLGVRGVPFFVFDRKYAISGAQESPVFLQTLEQAFTEWKNVNPGALLKVSEGASCKSNGSCD